MLSKIAMVVALFSLAFNATAYWDTHRKPQAQLLCVTHVGSDRHCTQWQVRP